MNINDIDVDKAIERIKRIAYKYRDMFKLLSFEDMQQEGFIGYMRGHATYEEGKGMSYQSWVTQNVVWAICAALTEESKQRSIGTDSMEVFGAYDTNDDGLHLKEVREDLAPQEQQVLDLRFWEGKTQEECAKIFGVVQRTVGKWEAVALEKMRVKLSEPGKKRADLMPDKGGRWFR